MAQTKEEKAAYYKAYYEANKEEIAAKAKARGKCKVYREAKLERQKRWREKNVDKIAAYQKVYYEDNKDKCREATKKWAVNNKEYFQEYAKKYRASGKRKEYQQNNKHIYQSSSSRYRALKRKQIPVHLRNCPQEKQRLLQTYKLSNILTEATGVQHHVDHMWPLNDGGPHWSGNLQVIPAYDNMSKHASVCEETKATIIKSLYAFDTSSPI